MKRRSLRVLLFILICAALVALAARCGLFDAARALLSDVRSAEDLRALISRAGPLAGLVFFLLQTLTVIFAPIPSNVTMMAGALALGFVPAMLIGIAAVLFGSMLVFLAARRLGRNAVRRIVDRGVLDRYLPLIEEKEDMFLFLTLLFPFFPDDALCILAGLTDIPAGRFFCIMALARPWGLVFAALLGSGALHLPGWAWGALIAVMAALFAVLMKYAGPIEDRLLAALSRLRGKGGKRP